MTTYVDNGTGLQTPVEIDVSIFQYTPTTVNFSLVRYVGMKWFPIDLTGYELKFRAKSVCADIAIVKDCVLIDAARGQIQVVFSANDFAVTGEYLGELQLFASGKEYAKIRFYFYVKPMPIWRLEYDNLR